MNSGEYQFLELSHHSYTLTRCLLQILGIGRSRGELLVKGKDIGNLREGPDDIEYISHES